MEEPSVRTSRLAIAGALAAAIAVGSAGFLLGRSYAPPAPAAPAPPHAVVVAPPPVLPAEPPAVLRRAELIAAAREAADATAAGDPLPDGVAQLAGRRFDLALPFGCSGPKEGEGAASHWSYDAEGGTLRVTVRPVTWRGEDWGLGRDAATAQTAEGFWMTRPWTARETCPPAAADAAPGGVEDVTLPGQTLAVAQFFPAEAGAEAEAPRALGTVQRIPPDRFDGSQGFVLRLIGRVATVPGGGPVRCVQPAGIDQRPICVIAIRPDEARVENPATQDVLATWPMARPRRD